MDLGVYLQTALLDLPSLLYRAIKVSNPAEFRHHLSRENGGRSISVRLCRRHTHMSRSNPSLLSRVSILCVVLATSSGGFGQAQASCTFKLFLLNPSSSTNPFTTGVNGVNDFGTTVGQANFGNTARGFIRYSGGGVVYFDAPNSLGT